MTLSPLDRARQRVVAFRATDAALVLARLAGEDDSTERHDAARARLNLGTGENRADLEEARSLRLLGPEADTLLLAHLADAARTEVMERSGTPLFIHGTETVKYEGRGLAISDLVREALDAPTAEMRPRLTAALAALDRDRNARREALDAGDEAADRVLRRGAASPDAAPSELTERCAAFLSSTDDVCRELTERLVHAHAPSAREKGARLLESLIGARGPCDWRPSRHAQAVTDVAAPLGLGRVLSARVRLETHQLVSLEVPVTISGEVALVHASPIELGALARLAVVESSLRGVALALATSTLAFELRVASSGSSLARAVGATLASALTQREVLVRSLGLETSVAGTTALAAALVLLLSARVRATRVIAQRERPTHEDARERGARALGLDEPFPSPELAHPSTATRPELEAAARASLAALAAGTALRERFDSDWGRNPRVEHLLRAACAHGPSLSAERWVLELGGDLEHAARFGRALGGDER